MRFLEPNQIPKRKSKPQPNPLERHEPFLRLQAMITQGKMKPYQQFALGFGPEDERLLGLKEPWRSATDRLKKLVRAAGLQADYHIVKYASDTPGEWIVRVSYEPPTTTQQTLPGTVEPAVPAARRGRPRKTA